MARGGSGLKIALYVVLGIIAVVIGVQVVQWLFGALLTALWYALVIGALVIGTMLVFRAARRALGGGDKRGRLPR